MCSHLTWVCQVQVASLIGLLLSRPLADEKFTVHSERWSHFLVSSPCVRQSSNKFAKALNEGFEAVWLFEYQNLLIGVQSLLEESILVEETRMVGNVRLYFVIAVVNVFCTTLTVLFVTNSLGGRCDYRTGFLRLFLVKVFSQLISAQSVKNLRPKWICICIDLVRISFCIFQVLATKNDIAAGSPVVLVQPNPINGSAVQSGGSRHLFSKAHFLSWNIISK